ncbi:MAG: MotA/TolQ/ExbB proton channel family protein [Akkermansiaceae bacterium]|nr:MotA/TolQ/ExbB proton channel family protein [Akkermansiaceae bacterium]
MAPPTGAQATNNEPGRLDVYDEQLAQGLNWQPSTPSERSIRSDDGYHSSTWLYLQSKDTPLAITGLSIPIREHPGENEYRYISFAWRKWGSGPISLQLDRDPAQDGEHQQGKRYNYRFEGGEPDPAGGPALRVSDALGGGWQTVTSDLWKDFGDFTITGITLTVGSRDAGIDAIAFAKDLAGFKPAAPVLQAKVTDAVEVANPAPPNAGGGVVVSDKTAKPSVDIDWGAQIKAGGWMMYPLYFAGLAAMVIAIQRLLTVRADRMAPVPLRRAVRELSARGGFEEAIRKCDEYPSTLGEALKFILKHRHAGMQIVTQSAGDIAGRDIRGHLSRIYPLSVIASLSPLLGLLGTIIGMVEAFGLVALYGDEGGAAILSDSISKALITTAAGLIIAVPCIAVFYVLKNRIMGFAAVIEVEVEELVTLIYLKEPQPEAESHPPSRKEEPADAD